MQKIKRAVNLYTNKDIYNIDKSALFKKIILDWTLKIKQTVESKYNKIILLLTLFTILLGFINLSLSS